MYQYALLVPAYFPHCVTIQCKGNSLHSVLQRKPEFGIRDVGNVGNSLFRVQHFGAKKFNVKFRKAEIVLVLVLIII